MNPNRTDEELILDYRKGDRMALDELIERYLKQVYVFVRRMTNDSPDADDITQDIFVKVWRNLDKFNAERSFRPWVFRIAKNATTDHFRKKRPLPFSLFDDDDGNNAVTDSLMDLSPLPDELLHRAELGELLAESIRELPEIYRQILLLRHQSHLSFTEIAEVLDDPINTVKSRHRRGLALLHKLLKNDPKAELHQK